MPRINKNRPNRTYQAESLISRLKAGQVLPIVSNIVSNNLFLNDHATLVEKYCTHINHPQPEPLPQVAQYHHVLNGNAADHWPLGHHYINFVKNHLFDMAEEANTQADILEEVEEQFDDLTFTEFATILNHPRFAEAMQEPFMMLANFPLPIYLTTSYHKFLELALIKAGKQPRTEFCRWHNKLENLPSTIKDDPDYEPTPAEPLVYHLHGIDEHPASLVLTQDDYFEFLVGISEYRGKAEDRIHERIRQALAESALLMLGYDLAEWEFRVLYWGLIKPRPQPPKSIFLQLDPTNMDKRYLEKYLSQVQFEVHWGELQPYLQGLWKQVTQ